MTLIDHFNAFQEVSMAKRFSANARSLYFAVLGEFNRLRYPADITLSNAYLQNLSGISSSCSFDKARNALINAGLIRHSKQHYTLSGALGEKTEKGFRTKTEKVEKEFRKSSESRGGYLTYPEQTLREREKEEDEDAPATTAQAAAQSLRSVNSGEVKRAWELWGGERLSGGQAFMMIEFEKRYGQAALLEAIETAGKSDRRGGLSIKYLEAVLEGRGKKASSPAPMLTDFTTENYDPPDD